MTDINLERSDYQQPISEIYQTTKEVINPVTKISDRKILDFAPREDIYIPPNPYRWEEDKEQIIRTLEAVHAAQMEELEEKLLTVLQPQVQPRLNSVAPEAVTTHTSVEVENGQEVIAIASKEQIRKQVAASRPFEEVLWFVRDEQTNSLREEVFDSEAEAAAIQGEVDMQEVAERLPGSDAQQVKSEIVKGSRRIDWAYQLAKEEIGGIGRRSIGQAKKIAREIWTKYTAVKLERDGNKVDYKQVRSVINPRETIFGGDLVESNTVYSRISRPVGYSKVEYRDLAVVVKGEEAAQKVPKQEVSDPHLTSNNRLATIRKLPSSLGADWRKF